MFSRNVRILNRSGLHARPAGLFAATAARFSSGIKVIRGEQQVDGRSILGLMLLAVSPGTEITIEASGEDEVQAVETLVELVERDFDENRCSEMSPTGGS